MKPEGGLVDVRPVPGSAVDEWVNSVWNQAAAFVVCGIETPWISDSPRTEMRRSRSLEDVDRLRRSIIEGHYIDGVVRSLPNLEIVLRDVRDVRLAAVVLIGSDIISWERDEFGNDFELESCLDLWLFLAELGIPGTLSRLAGPLMLRLGLEEGEQQFRSSVSKLEIPAVMLARRAPRPLWTWLGGFSSRDAERVSSSELERHYAVLTAGIPEPAERARALLAWWGSLSWYSEATAGEGLLIKEFLSRIDRTDILRSLESELDAAVVMGALTWASAIQDEEGVAERVGPELRKLLQ
jgi:hypothetical protein